jgi:cytochrome P450
MKEIINPVENMTEELWCEKLTFLKLGTMSYTANVLNETLRLDPPF